MRIVFTGGGTGGHFFPILAVARELKRIAEEARILDLELFYFGPEEYRPELLRAEGILFIGISAGKLRRYFSLWNLADLFKAALGILQAVAKMFIVMPDVVFAKGGFGSFPTLLAARIYRIPVIIHETDARPGRVNRWAGKWARRIAVSFSRAASYFPAERTALTGTPVRKRILGGNPEEAREAFGVFSERPVIFVTGGSQGPRAVNQAVIEILKDLVARCEVIHQAGQKNLEDVRLETAPILEGGGSAFYHLAGFLEEGEMRGAYRLADLIVSRAGGTAIAEIALAAKPAILIPLANAAQDHQRENAYEYAHAGAAVVIEEKHLTPLILKNEVEKLLDDPGRPSRTAEAAKAFSRPDAAEMLAKEILTLGL